MGDIDFVARRLAYGPMALVTRSRRVLPRTATGYGGIGPSATLPLLDRCVGPDIDFVVAYIEDALAYVLHEMCAEVGELEDRIGGVERQLQALSRQTAPIEQLQTIPGIGLLTSTALVGFVGDMRRFSSSRQFASYLGLTPREHSSGLRRGLGRIGKRGDTYLRMLLIHGARSALRAAKSRNPTDCRPGLWSRSAAEAAVALANKMARLVWAVSTRGVSYQSQYVPA